MTTYEKILEDISSLFGKTVEVYAYNQVQEERTWEPMIFAEFGPISDDGSVYVAFVPRHYSEAFPGDVVGWWAVNRLLQWVRRREEAL